MAGTLYGTTEKGGSQGCGRESNYNDCGTVFSVTTSGTESVLHTFTGPDGSNPDAALINVDGTLYGTTAKGGVHPCGCGTVFSITTGGTENVAYSFNGHHHPNTPLGGLLDAGGTLYGTTYGGGGHGEGTVFSMTPGDRLKVLHNFGQKGTGWNRWPRPPGRAGRGKGHVLRHDGSWWSV